MSRRRLPRRPTIAVFVVAAALGAILTGSAAAQNNTGSRTVYGTSLAMMCSQAAVRGDASDEAIATCGRSLGQEQLSPMARIGVYNNRGALHLRRREGQAALDDFNAVLALDDKNAEAFVNRGAALIMIGQPGPAVASITSALLAGVRDPHKAYFNRGAAREALGDLRGAYEDYNTALEIQPDWGPAEAELARFARARREQLASVVGVATQGTALPGAPNGTEGTP